MAAGGRFAGERRVLRCLGVWLSVEAELVEVGRGAVAIEVDGRLRALVDDESVAVEREEESAEIWVSARSWASVGSMRPARMSCPSPRLLRVASACRGRAGVPWPNSDLAIPERRARR